MKIFFQKLWVLLFAVSFVGCTKYATTSNNTTNTSSTTTTVVAPKIKFFNVMDYGATNVYLNATKVTSVAKFYASSYLTAKEGVNSIKITFANNTSTLLDVSHTLANNSNYSCFFYKVGNEWKSNLVRDDLPATINTGFAALRVLDFRTEAYLNYINVRLICPGFDIIDQKNRNFLDHTTYDGFTKFSTVGAGSYGIYMYNDTITSSYRKGVNIDSKGIYSVILTTPTGISPASDAIFQIFPDVAKHN